MPSRWISNLTVWLLTFLLKETGIECFIVRLTHLVSTQADAFFYCTSLKLLKLFIINSYFLACLVCLLLISEWHVEWTLFYYRDFITHQQLSVVTFSLTCSLNPSIWRQNSCSYHSNGKWKKKRWVFMREPNLLQYSHLLYKLA